MFVSRTLPHTPSSTLAYRWLGGGMPLDAHTLSDVRVASGGDLDRLPSESLAGVLAEALFDLDAIIPAFGWMTLQGGVGGVVLSLRLIRPARSVGP